MALNIAQLSKIITPGLKHYLGSEVKVAYDFDRDCIVVQMGDYYMTLTREFIVDCFDYQHILYKVHSHKMLYFSDFKVYKKPLSYYIDDAVFAKEAPDYVKAEDELAPVIDDPEAFGYVHGG